MIRRARYLLVPAVICSLACAARGQEIIDPAEAQTDPDFLIKGEYVGEGVLKGARQKSAPR